MNDRRILIGVFTWFLGIIVPAAHHVALYAVGHNARSDNVVRDMDLVFNGLPWIDFLYFAFMMLAGLALIASAFISRGSGNAE